MLRITRDQLLDSSPSRSPQNQIPAQPCIPRAQTNSTPPRARRTSTRHRPPPAKPAPASRSRPRKIREYSPSGSIHMHYQRFPGVEVPNLIRPQPVKRGEVLPSPAGSKWPSRPRALHRNPAGSASRAITISDRYVCRKYPPSGCGSSCSFSIQYFAFWFVNLGSVANKSRKSAFSCQDPLDDVVPVSG